MRHTNTAGGMRRRFGLMAAIARFLTAAGNTGGAETDAAMPRQLMPVFKMTSGPDGIAPIPRRVPNQRQRQRRKMVRNNPRLAARYRKGGRK